MLRRARDAASVSSLSVELGVSDEEASLLSDDDHEAVVEELQEVGEMRREEGGGGLPSLSSCLEAFHLTSLVIVLVQQKLQEERDARYLLESQLRRVEGLEESDVREAAAQ